MSSNFHKRKRVTEKTSTEERRAKRKSKKKENKGRKEMMKGKSMIVKNIGAVIRGRTWSRNTIASVSSSSSSRLLYNNNNNNNNNNNLISPANTLAAAAAAAPKSELGTFGSLLFRRNLCTPPPSGSSKSNIVPIHSEQDFQTSLNNVQEKSLPGIFYFTAVWCGPCKFLSPVIEELSGKYPHVTVYKVDIDQERLQSTLSKLSVSAVPTLEFYQNGEKTAAIVGADVTKLKDTMKALYG